MALRVGPLDANSLDLLIGTAVADETLNRSIEIGTEFMTGMGQDSRILVRYTNC